MPLWAQTGTAISGQSAPELLDVKGSIGSSMGATGCPTDHCLSPPFGGHRPGCPHSWDRGRGIYQQALMVLASAVCRSPPAEGMEGGVVGDSAGWDPWGILGGQTQSPASPGGLLALRSATGAGGLFLASWSCQRAEDGQGGRWPQCTFSTLSTACCKCVEAGSCGQVLWIVALRSKEFERQKEAENPPKMVGDCGSTGMVCGEEEALWGS